jgi:hypothetical protein
MPQTLLRQHKGAFDLGQRPVTFLTLRPFEDEPGRRSAAKLLTRDEARRITVNIAKLPGLLARQIRVMPR